MKRFAFTGSWQDRTIMRVIARSGDADQGMRDFASMLSVILQREGFDGAWRWYVWQVQYMEMQSIWRIWNRFG